MATASVSSRRKKPHDREETAATARGLVRDARQGRARLTRPHVTAARGAPRSAARPVVSYALPWDLDRGGPINGDEEGG